MQSEKHFDVIETTLLRGKVKLIQPKKGFRASMDTVFLAAAVPVKDRWNVLDICCGVGSAGLCVTSRNPTISLTGMDIQQGLIDLAHLNAGLNGLQDSSRFICANVLKEKDLENNYFHSVLINPPYQKANTHIISLDKIKAFSHGEEASGITLKKLIKYAHSKIKNGFYITIIHRADRLDEILSIMTDKKWFGSIEIIPLWPRIDEPAKRVIIRARKERYTPLKMHPGIALHEKDGRYTKEALDISEKGLALYQ